jgi:hypothetical protein
MSLKSKNVPKTFNTSFFTSLLMSVRVIIAISNVEPYSPDLNPIEHLWANMKKWLKKHSCEFEEISKAILNFLV